MNRHRLLLLLAALAGCTPAPRGPLAGSGVGGPFAMTDQDGRVVTERTYDGRYRLMYFGYTFCPDVCPTDVQRIAQGVAAFAARDPGRARRVVALFVTVDPERDSVAAVRTFVRAFSPTLVGLTGTPAQAAAMRHAFRIYAAKAGSGRSYLVDHSATIYLMDPANRPVSFLDHGATTTAIAAELATYVR